MLSWQRKHKKIQLKINQAEQEVKKKVSREIDGFNAFMLALAKDRLADSKKGVSHTA